MTTKETSITNSPEGTEAVIAFLRDHPNLLVEHPDLLSEITIPHSTGAATSLVERQVSVLREQVRQHKNQLKELIEIASENGQLSDRLHLLAEKLIKTADIESIISTIKKALISDFKADKIVLRFLAEPTSENDKKSGKKNDPKKDHNIPKFVGDKWLDKSLFEEAISNKSPLCGRLNEEQHHSMFGDEVPEYGSSVLVPLLGKDWVGLLAIGSQSPDRYTKDMGTDILSQLADIVTLAIGPHVTT